MKMKNNQKIPVSILADREVFEYLKEKGIRHFQPPEPVELPEPDSLLVSVDGCFFLAVLYFLSP